MRTTLKEPWNNLDFIGKSINSWIIFDTFLSLINLNNKKATKKLLDEISINFWIKITKADKNTMSNIIKYFSIEEQKELSWIYFDYLNSGMNSKLEDIDDNDSIEIDKQQIQFLIRWHIFKLFVQIYSWSLSNDDYSELSISQIEFTKISVKNLFWYNIQK